MQTKAVYVVVSQPTDVYFEQAWISAWSLKHYTPDMEVVFVVDQATYDGIYSSYRQRALDVIDRVVSVAVPEKYHSPTLRSRYLKTSLREHIRGSFLFLDSDTVVCGNISEVDTFAHPLMMVQDGHCPLSESITGHEVRRLYHRIFHERYTGNTYYNSGVIYCQDTPATHTFYQIWHRTWQKSMATGHPNDQPALLHTDIRHCLISEMDGIYNSQVRYSVYYLIKGKILHYFNHILPINDASPFYDTLIYRQVQKDRGISADMVRTILHCKELYPPQSYISAGRELRLRFDYPYRLLLLSYMRMPRYYRFLALLSRWQYRLFLRLFR